MILTKEMKKTIENALVDMVYPAAKVMEYAKSIIQDISDLPDIQIARMLAEKEPDYTRKSSRLIISPIADEWYIASDYYDSFLDRKDEDCFYIDTGFEYALKNGNSERRPEFHIMFAPSDDGKPFFNPYRLTLSENTEKLVLKAIRLVVARKGFRAEVRDVLKKVRTFEQLIEKIPAAKTISIKTA